MAADDVASMPAATNKAVRTAGDNITEVDYEGNPLVDLEAVNRQLAAEAGVKDAAFIDYDVALETHASRSDIEDLAHKNARDMPAKFADAAFMRRTDTSQWDNEFVDDDVNTMPAPDYTATSAGASYEQVGGDIDSDANATTPEDTDEGLTQE